MVFSSANVRADPRKDKRGLSPEPAERAKTCPKWADGPGRSALGSHGGLGAFFIALYGLAKADVMTVQILSAKFPTTVGLIAKPIVDRRAAFDKLRVECIDIGHPKVDIP